MIKIDRHHLPSSRLIKTESSPTRFLEWFSNHLKLFLNRLNFPTSMVDILIRPAHTYRRVDDKMTACAKEVCLLDIVCKVSNIWWNILLSSKTFTINIKFCASSYSLLFTSCWLAENYLSWNVLLCYLKANCKDHQ